MLSFIVFLYYFFLVLYTVGTTALIGHPYTVWGCVREGAFMCVLYDLKKKQSFLYYGFTAISNLHDRAGTAL